MVSGGALLAAMLGLQAPRTHNAYLASRAACNPSAAAQADAAFWANRRDAATRDYERKLRELSELEQRDKIALSGLSAAVSERDAAIAAASSTPPLTAASVQRELAAQSADDAEADTSDVEPGLADLEQIETTWAMALAEAEREHEVQLQRVAAFWIARVAAAEDAADRARSEAQASAAASPPTLDAELPAVQPLAGKTPQQRIEELETTVEELMEENYYLGDRIEVLDELVFAKEESERSMQVLELVRERDVQRTAAFWLDRLNTEREAAATRMAELQAQSNEGASETIAELRQAVERLTFLREADVQRTSAFWIDRLETERGGIEAKVSLAVTERLLRERARALGDMSAASD